MARRPSSIDRLPKPLKELIAELRGQGRGIDEILAKLRELDAKVSRSALGRHTREIDAAIERAGEEMRRHRAIADALVERGLQTDSRAAEVNIELMHALVTKLLIPPEGDAPVSLDAQDAYFLGTALQRLGQARKVDVDRILKVREEERKAAAGRAVKAAENAGAAQGFKLPPEALKAIREQVYGIVEPG